MIDTSKFMNKVQIRQINSEDLVERFAFYTEQYMVENIVNGVEFDDLQYIFDYVNLLREEILKRMG